jgi:hypothetical protein
MMARETIATSPGKSHNGDQQGEVVLSDLARCPSAGDVEEITEVLVDDVVSSSFPHLSPSSPFATVQRTSLGELLGPILGSQLSKIFEHFTDSIAPTFPRASSHVTFNFPGLSSAKAPQ